jgi:uncharacterized SAM-binding protein YcdF (DUF218 family)
MAFVVFKLLDLVFSSGNFMGLLVIVGAVLLFTGWARLGKWLVLAGAALIALTIFLPVGAWLLRPLEDNYPRGKLPSHVDGILVLGGGLDSTISIARHVPPAHISLGRLIAGAELARKYPGARIIFSAGSAALAGERPSERAAAEITFAELGLSKARVVYEDRSRNTWENFVYSKGLVHPRTGERWLLVTSAEHMTRAMAVAKRLGWTMIPWPSDYLTPRGNPMSLRSNLVVLEIALHEYLGLIYYRFSGRAEW